MAEMCTIIRTAAKRLLDAGRFTVENKYLVLSRNFNLF